MLNPTPPELLVDAGGHPYFLWDSKMTLEEFRQALRSADPEIRAYLTGKLMRQAKPDDVFTFVTPREIRDLWPRLERYLGKKREFWTCVVTYVLPELLAGESVAMAALGDDHYSWC